MEEAEVHADAGYLVLRCALRSGPGMARGIPTRQGQGNHGELDEGSAQGYEQLNARALVESIRSMS